MLRPVAALMLAGALVAGCAASPPKTQAKRSQLEIDANEALAQMTAKNPSLRQLLAQSAGYIVFPEVKRGGFVVGGGGGKGVVYEHGQVVGFADLSQASFGALVGGASFAELVAVRDPFTFRKIKAGSFDVGGQASAVILKAGAATAATWDERGVAIVVDPKGGAMLNASVSGQRIKATM